MRHVKLHVVLRKPCEVDVLIEALEVATRGKSRCRREVEQLVRETFLRKTLDGAYKGRSVPMDCR